MLGAIINDIVKFKKITKSTLMSIEVTKALISGYGNEELTEKEIMRVINKDKDFLPYVVSASAWLYNNLRDVENYTEISAKSITDNTESIKEAKALSASIFLARMGASKEYIKEYVTETYSLHILFESESFKDALNKDNNSIVIAEAYYGIDDEIYSEISKYLDEKCIDFINNYNETLSNLRNEKISMMNKILEYKPYFDKKEIVRWLPTNNRKTPEFFADYGQEVNDLIRLINNPYFIDFKYTDTIRRLKIHSFKEAIPTANILGIRAMLTSIIRRERFGVGTISRAIADGLISALLERYQEILNDRNI
ncbi:DUF6508 domain-containing protein [Streptobacillus ratti]|uniref:DUF6508 domain-containing protein n=1 Tax=Streptobacillus ratti TaxID=1720557 RepID=UPI0009324944|nr:DUF6508 domain-containing protein [Streptobacillus ratti]